MEVAAPYAASGISLRRPQPDIRRRHARYASSNCGLWPSWAVSNSLDIQPIRSDCAATANWGAVTARGYGSRLRLNAEYIHAIILEDVIGRRLAFAIIARDRGTVTLTGVAKSAAARRENA